MVCAASPRLPAYVFASQAPTALAEALGGRTRPLADVAVYNEVERWSRWMSYPEGQVHALRAAAWLIVVMPPSRVGRQVSRLASRPDLDPYRRDRGCDGCTHRSYCEYPRHLVSSERMPLHPKPLQVAMRMTRLLRKSDRFLR
jgi:hypothetical protein